MGICSADANVENENERESGGGEVSESSRTQCAVGAWLRCCREASVDKRRRGEGWEEGLLTHVGAGGGVRRGEGC